MSFKLVYQLKMKICNLNLLILFKIKSLILEIILTRQLVLLGAKSMYKTIFIHQDFLPISSQIFPKRI